MKQKNRLISIAMATLMLVSLYVVCASTSVSAASPPGQPIAAGTGPSAVMLQGSESMYVFVKGYDGALWYRIFSLQTMFWTGGWSSLGGQLTSSPCAVSREASRMDVYVRGTNGAVYEKAYYNGAWYNWGKVGGQVAPGTGPGASGWPGREDVFVKGTNGALCQKTWTAASGWSGWANLGGTLTSSPAAVSRQAGLIDVHARGTNGADYYRAYHNGAWHRWATLGGQIAPGTGPALSVWRANPVYPIIDREDVFVKGTNGACYQKTWTAAKGWTTTWATLGGQLTSSPTVATKLQWHAFQLFARWSNGNLVANEWYWDGGTVYRWHGWMLGAQGPPCSVDCY